MSVIWSIAWGILVVAVMSITIKYYLPLLSERLPVTASEVSAASGDADVNSKPVAGSQEGYRSFILKNRIGRMVALTVCAGFSAWCGYAAAEHALAITGMFKMTLGMCVLSCIVITDLELMVIPNLCSLVLLGGRAITVICEFIWFKDEASALLLNSVIALVSSLLLLLVMSKVTRGGLGMGDVKLLSSLGFLCGIRSVCYTLMFAFLLCALASAGLLLSRRKQLKDALPLGPFIWLGYGVTILLSIM